MAGDPVEKAVFGRVSVHATRAVLFMFVSILAGSCGGNSGTSDNGSVNRDEKIECTAGPPSDENAGYVHGSVFDSDSGDPVDGAVIEFDSVQGCVTSDDGGSFSIPLPEGGTFKLIVKANGMTNAFRTGNVPPGHHLSLGDIFLKPLDPATTKIGPSGGVHQSSKGGLTLSFPKGALGKVVDVRATRFDRSRELPAPLPKTSHFTMAFEATVQGEKLKKPVHVSIPNDYGFPPGTQVPVGAFDPEAGEWLPSTMGKVSEDGKTIEFDATHFTAYDANFPVVGSETPGLSGRKRKRPKDPCGRNQSKGSSSIDIRAGTLNLEVEIPLGRYHGRSKNLVLSYDSDTALPSAWIGGLRTENPSDLEEKPEYAGIEVQIEGLRHLVYVDLAEEKNWVAYLWNGKNVQGELVRTGLYDAWLRAFYALPGVFATADVFGGPPKASLGIEAGELVEADAEVYSKLALINNVDSPVAAGWSIKEVLRLFLHPDGTALLVDGGENLGVFAPSGRIEVLAAAPDGGNDCSDGSPGENRCLDYPKDLAAGPDGSVYFANDDAIVEITAAGEWRTVYDGSSGEFSPVCVAVSPEGKLYTCDESSGSVYEVTDTGLVKVVGGGPMYWPGTGMEPTVSNPTDIAFGPDGNMYIADWPMGLRRLDQNGVLESIEPADNPDYPAPYRMAIGPDGSVYMAELNRCRIRKLLPDGTMRTIAGTDSKCSYAGDDGPARSALLSHPNDVALAGDGTLYICDQWNHLIRAVDTDGIIKTAAGKGYQAGSGFGFGGPATNALIKSPEAIAVNPEGDLLILFNKLDEIAAKVDFSAHIYGRPLGSKISLTYDTADNVFVLERYDGSKALFDDKGFMKEYIDDHGLKSIYKYDDSNRLTEITGPGGESIDISYGSNGISSIRGPGGRTAVFAVGQDRDLEKITFPDGTENSYSYDARHLMTGWTDAEGRKASYEYDTYGRIKSVDRNMGRRLAYRPLETQSLLNQYLVRGKGSSPDDLAPALTEPKVQVVDAGGETYEYEYDVTYEITKAKLPDGTEITLKNATCLMPSIVVLPDGFTITNYFDEWGRLLKQSSPLGDQTFEYDFDKGLLLGFNTLSGDTINFTYYEDGNLKEILDYRRKAKFTFDYEDDGQISRILDATGITVEYTYDDKGNLVSVNSAVGEQIRFARDARGNITAFTDGSGAEYEFTYDDMDRVVGVIDPTGASHVIKRDGQGLVTGLLSGDWKRTFGRDEAGRLVAVSNAGAPAWNLEYDNNDMVSAIVSPNGRVDVKRDTVGRVIDRYISRDGGSEHAVFEYDKAGRLVSAKDDDSSITYERDPRTDLITSVTQYHSGMAGPVTLTYSVDAGNRVEQVTYPAMDGFAGGDVYYSYDDFFGLVTEVTDPNGDYYDFIRDDAGRLINLQVNGGADFDSEIARDAAGRAVGITYFEDYWRETTLLSIRDTLAVDGVRTSTVVGTDTIDYSYDEARRLTAAVYSDTRPDESYDYDEIGDLKGPGIEYDAYKRLTKAAGYLYEYDDAGRVVKRTKESDSSRMEFFWDGDDNLVEVDLFDPGDQTPSHVVRYRYDAFGRRISREEDGKLTFYIYDRENLVMEVDDQGEVQAFYLYGGELDRPFVMFKNGERYVLLSDMMGTILGIFKLSDKSMASTMKYSALGSLLEKNGTMDCLFGFQGRVMDPMTGLVNFRTREYDPQIGRFLSTDPLKFTSFAHMYAFPGMDPVNRSDPFGMGPKAIRSLGEGVMTYNGAKGRLEKGVVKVAGGEGSATGEAARMVFKTSANAVIDTATKAASLSPYQAYGPTVVDAAGYFYEMYKAKDPCERAKVGGKILKDVVGFRNKKFGKAVDDFNNLGNLIHIGR